MSRVLNREFNFVIIIVVFFNINDEVKTILIVTHEPDIAQMTKRIVDLKDGLIINDTRIEPVKAMAHV